MDDNLDQPERQRTPIGWHKLTDGFVVNIGHTLRRSTLRFLVLGPKVEPGSYRPLVASGDLVDGGGVVIDHGELSVEHIAALSELGELAVAAYRTR